MSATTRAGCLLPSHSPMAPMSAAAFRRISSYSPTGSDWTTMAPPAPMLIPCSSMTAVRMTMLRSNAPLKLMNPMDPE